MNNLAVGITLVIILVSVGVIYTVTQWDLPIQNTQIQSGQPQWVL